MRSVFSRRGALADDLTALALRWRPVDAIANQSGTDSGGQLIRQSGFCGDIGDVRRPCGVG